MYTANDTVEKIIRIVDATLHDAKQIGYRIFPSVMLPQVFLRSNYAVVIRASATLTQDAWQQVQEYRKTLLNSEDCQELWIQFGEAEDGIPTIWISLLLWPAGGYYGY